MDKEPGQVLRGHCAAIGRDYETIAKTWQCECVAIAPTQSAAEALAQASPFYAGADASLVGTPAQVIDQIEAWADPLRRLPPDRGHPPLHGRGHAALRVAAAPREGVATLALFYAYLHRGRRGSTMPPGP